jgi:hypothetical protein
MVRGFRMRHSSFPHVLEHFLSLRSMRSLRRAWKKAHIRDHPRFIRG